MEDLACTILDPRMYFMGNIREEFRGKRDISRPDLCGALWSSDLTH